ncbi:restriction endonuclease [Aliarcobacter butzleri]|uniref:restriction endonuclease n=1 Tax=Aliarcobacter butzleri TaxID=28197 RepID=UPI00189E10C8|nr:restriction endonuclease [Aliarcobacter butzleri]MBF7071504.1 restriction endonuclease [Aliarcobacter butzleri]
MEKTFISEIENIIKEDFGKENVKSFLNIPIIQYLIKKTNSANRGVKTRGSFANIYAIYVLLEDYITNKFDETNNYSIYEGAIFTNLYNRQRELPFGNKLQNHAYQGRLNEDFKKYFPLIESPLLIRDTKMSRYWINENLIIFEDITNMEKFNLAKTIIKIIEKYIEVKQNSMSNFIEKCNQLKELSNEDIEKVKDFINSLLNYNVDARLFEIVSYSILKFFYKDKIVFFGYDRENIYEENLKLYKTGRTNANDGGIDFVMKPLGRFFQVTETTDFKKYFLDIDKIEKFPITFVVKTMTDIKVLKEEIEKKAFEIYRVQTVVTDYINSIEELINIPILIERFKDCIKNNYTTDILNEIILQSKVEFHFEN